jgi:UDP-glucuronate decarboxylase
VVARVKRVLLTGASGFLGSHCIATLVSRGFEVHTASRRPLGAYAGSVSQHHVELLDLSRHAQLMADVKPSHLLHLAWTTKPAFEATTDGKVRGALDHLDWVTVSLSLARAFAEAGGERLVFGGSSAEYDWNYGYCSETLTPTNPDTLYGAAKHALRVLIDAHTRDRGLSSAWARVFFSYGPRELPRRLVPATILALLAGRPALCSHGEQVRDYMHAQDVADALVQLLDSPIQGAVNVASGRGTPLKDILSRIGVLFGRPDLIKLGAVPPRANDSAFVVANNQKLVTEVGWQQKIDLEAGLQQSIDWWRENPTDIVAKR